MDEEDEERGEGRPMHTFSAICRISASSSSYNGSKRSLPLRRSRLLQNFISRQELLKTNEELPVLGEEVPDSLLTQDFLNQVRAPKTQHNSEPATLHLLRQ